MSSSPSPVTTAHATPFPAWSGLVLLVLTVLTAAACFWGNPTATKSEPGIVMQLPGELLGMWGSEQPVSESEKVILPADTEFAKKLYSDGMGNDIHCQIVLAGAEKRSIHRPEVCLPAQGWTIKSGEVVPVKLSDGRLLDVMKLTVARPVTLNNGSQRELTTIFCYWFIGKNTTTPHHFIRLLKTNFDMLLHNINHRWAYVIVNAPVLEGFVAGGKDLPATTARIESAIAELAPQITPNQ